MSSRRRHPSSVVPQDGAKKVLRCAIYTRVSSDGGLEQDFNSLHAQREACEAYAVSQAREGWRLRPDPFDDGGFSGGSMERPALQRLLERVRRREIDVILVYKVDRLTRSLADFAKLVELFDDYEVSFVSITQSFNTTTSMGRLTLNVLLSFAQFEREVTGERIRDKIAASKKKGLWVGGVVPFGYRLVDHRLVPDEAEAPLVREIFVRYLRLRSIRLLAAELDAAGIRTRPRRLSSGRTIGGVPFTAGPLAHLLKNATYLGRINHRGAKLSLDPCPDHRRGAVRGRAGDLRRKPWNNGSAAGFGRPAHRQTVRCGWTADDADACAEGKPALSLLPHASAGGTGSGKGLGWRPACTSGGD